MDYPQYHWTVNEQERLKPFFSNLDKPVFTIHNLPEVVKGALFARYSRYEGDLRRLFLDEFSEQIDTLPLSNSIDSSKAEQLYDRVFLGFGDDSVAQLGGTHIACEYSSNILTKILQRPRLAAYLEQSTRYIAFDKKMSNGNYRYYSRPEWGEEYHNNMDNIFSIYSTLIEQTLNKVQNEHVYTGSSKAEQSAYNRATKAKTLDILRGLLPASTLSHMGIYATGQTYEQLILHLLAHPLPEAREVGEMMYQELCTVIPSFLTRVKRPDRGGEWVKFLQEREEKKISLAEELGLHEETNDDNEQHNTVKLVDYWGDIDALLAAELSEVSNQPQHVIENKLARFSQTEKEEKLRCLVGERQNRRHRPGRGWERIFFKFEVTSDYGAFRDLQRHRMCTFQWQNLTPSLGALVPQEIEDYGLKNKYQEALDISQKSYDNLYQNFGQKTASYAVSLGYRIRYTITLNAREAMQLIELRSGREGHPSYRAVALSMLEQIQDKTPWIAEAMTFTDHTSEPRLERMMSEIRNSKREELRNTKIY